MEVSLIESEIYSKDIFEHVGVGIAYTSLDGKVLAINKTLEDIIELPKEDIVGKQSLSTNNNEQRSRNSFHRR